MKKIFTLALAASLLSVNALSAHSTNEGDGKAKQNQDTKPDSSLTVNDEQQVLDNIANDAEAIYYSQLSGKQSQTNISISSNTKTKQRIGKKTSR